MSEALSLIYDTLDVFSGKKKSLKENSDMKNHDPYFTKARFDSVRPEPGKQIKKGDETACHSRTKEDFHSSSKQAEELRGMQFSRSLGMDDANW
jgi:hypothetical protein